MAAPKGPQKAVSNIFARIGDRLGSESAKQPSPAEASVGGFTAPKPTADDVKIWSAKFKTFVANGNYAGAQTIYGHMYAAGATAAMIAALQTLNPNAANFIKADELAATDPNSYLPGMMKLHEQRTQVAKDAAEVASAKFPGNK